MHVLQLIFTISIKHKKQKGSNEPFLLNPFFKLEDFFKTLLPDHEAI